VTAQARADGARTQASPAPQTACDRPISQAIIGGFEK
jgi:hypothetical protein